MAANQKKATGGDETMERVLKRDEKWKKTANVGFKRHLLCSASETLSPSNRTQAQRKKGGSQTAASHNGSLNTASMGYCLESM